MPSDVTLNAHETVAGFGTYAEAQRAVDRLSDQKFPVEHALIIGVGLRLVEQVLGRLTYLRAAWMGLGAGAWIGLLIGLFFAIFTPGRFPFILVLWGLVWGAVAGAIFGLIGHALTGGKRDFLSKSSIVADRYEVLVANAYAAEARRLLNVGPSPQMPQQI